MAKVAQTDEAGLSAPALQRYRKVYQTRAQDSPDKAAAKARRPQRRVTQGASVSETRKVLGISEVDLAALRQDFKMSPASKARFAKVAEEMSRIGAESKNHWHVIPTMGRWKVLRARARRATRVLPSRSEAVTLARSLAQSVGGEVFIHREDGTMQERQVSDYAGGPLKTVYTSSRPD
jgi:hypothetical protein